MPFVISARQLCNGLVIQEDACDLAEMCSRNAYKKIELWKRHSFGSRCTMCSFLSWSTSKVPKGATKQDEAFSASKSTSISRGRLSLIAIVFTWKSRSTFWWRDENISLFQRRPLFWNRRRSTWIKLLFTITLLLVQSCCLPLPVVWSNSFVNWQAILAT